MQSRAPRFKVVKSAVFCRLGVLIWPWTTWIAASPSSELQLVRRTDAARHTGTPRNFASERQPPGMLAEG